MKATLKKLILCLSVLSLFFNSSYLKINSSKGSNINIKQKYFADISKEDELLDEYIEFFDFYYLDDLPSKIIVADCLKSVNDFNIYELKLILEPSKYNFDNPSVLFTEEYVIEIVYFDANQNIEKKYEIPNETQVEIIKNKAKIIEKESEIYERIITSLNFEIDNNDESIALMTADNDSKNAGENVISVDGNNQILLDDYLNHGNVIIPTLVGENGNTIQYYSYDDSIVNLIPKEVFRNKGSYSFGGGEWGGFALTKAYSDEKYVTSLILYDIISTKLDIYNSEAVIIKPIYKYDYFYYLDEDVVVKYQPNNLCLANPTFKAMINYVQLTDFPNMTKHYNDYEDGYKYENDEGFAFLSSASKLVGTHKNSKDQIDSTLKILSKAVSLALNVATSKLSFVTQTIISEAYDYLSEKLIESINEYNFPSNVAYVSKNDGKYITNVECEIGNAGSFSALKDMYKAIERLPKTYINSFVSNNDNSPLLFKNTTDSMNYNFSIITPDKNNDYSAMLCHHLDFDVFNDNSSIFKNYPDYLGKSSNYWNYLIGKNINPKSNQTIKENQELLVISGEDSKQTIKFTPKKTGKYIIKLVDYQYNSEIQLENYSASNSGYKEFNNGVDPFNENKKSESNLNNLFDKKKVSNIENLEIKHLLEGSKTYSIYFSRKYMPNSENSSIYNLFFGTAKLVIYYDNNLSLEPINVQNDFNDNSKQLSIIHNGSNSMIKFIPTKSAQYTFSTISKSYAYSPDTNLKLLDNNHNFLIFDDNSYGGLLSGIRYYLIANQTYYLIFDAKSNYGEYILEVSNQLYIPQMKGRMLDYGILFSQFGNPYKFVIYETKQIETRSITFSAIWYSAYANFSDITLQIYDSNSLLLSKYQFMNNPVNFIFQKNKLYKIRLVINGSSEAPKCGLILKMEGN